MPRPGQHTASLPVPSHPTLVATSQQPLRLHGRVTVRYGLHMNLSPAWPPVVFLKKFLNRII